MEGVAAWETKDKRSNFSDRFSSKRAHWVKDCTGDSDTAPHAFYSKNFLNHCKTLAFLRQKTVTAEDQRGIRQNRRWIKKKHRGATDNWGRFKKIELKTLPLYFILTKQLCTSLISYIRFASSPIFPRNFFRDLFATPRVTCHTSGAIFFTLV